MQSSTENLSRKYRLGGPQVDRDMKWIVNDSELLQSQQREELNIDSDSEKRVHFLCHSFLTLEFYVAFIRISRENSLASIGRTRH